MEMLCFVFLKCDFPKHFGAYLPFYLGGELRGMVVGSPSSFSSLNKCQTDRFLGLRGPGVGSPSEWPWHSSDA